MEKELYSVTDVCELTGITRKTLFYYDKTGLLKPTMRKGTQNHKYYDPEQIKLLRRILRYRCAGLSIAEVKVMLTASKDKRLQILEKALARLETEAIAKSGQIENVKTLISETKQE